MRFKGGGKKYEEKEVRGRARGKTWGRGQRQRRRSKAKEPVRE